MRAQFLWSEIRIGLKRNLTMTAAAVLTVAISLGLLGTGLLLHEQVDTMKTYWYGKIDVQVFLKKDVTVAQESAIGNTLHGLPGVKWVHFVNQQEAYRVFQHDFANEPALVKATQPSALPESFVVKLTNPNRYGVVVQGVGNLPGVDVVQSESTYLKSLFSFMDALERAAWGAAALGGLTACLLVFNTIRVAAYNRRRETGIMRLVGASRTYIQAPFVLEGALAGLAGSILSIAGLAGLKSWLVDGQIAPHLRFINIIHWPAVYQMFPLLIAVGVVVTAMASFLTLRRYVRI
jgi:cell division transport system permease protein